MTQQTPTANVSTYYAALKLVQQIDYDLDTGRRHYRNRAGELLTTLDQVVTAILADDLQPPPEPEPALIFPLPALERMAA